MNASGGLHNFSDNCGQISSILAEFDSSIMPKIKEAIETYWEQSADFRLFDITNFEKVKDDNYLKGDIFFTSQVPASLGLPITMRLSSEFARLFLHGAFGSNSGEFKLLDLSELEIRILNGFCDFMYKLFAPALVAPEAVQKAKLRDKEIIHFVVVVKNKESKNSKIIISIPKNRLNAKEIELKDNFSDEDFKNLSIDVDIEAGSSRVTLNDLKYISEGDIILLEDSKINKMIVHSASVSKEFNVNPNPNLVIEIDEEDEEINDSEEAVEKTMWDDIQIEINARFKKVKMSLGELKQISAGMVIDLGSIFNNEISLFVEDKTVARGDLVIINDKYAVKINEVINENQEPPKKQQAPAQKAPEAQKAPLKPQGQPQPQRQAPNQAQPQAQRPKPQGQPQAQSPQQRPKPNAQEVEEDFDYSNFEEEK